MTEPFDPNRTGGPSDADQTSRTPTPPTPTAPLTPAGRTDASTSTQTSEPTWTAAPASAVVRDGAPGRSGRLRWAISLTIVALVVVATVVAATLLTGASSTASVLGYVPDGSVAYTQVRLDLPGDQRRAVGAFLSKFPGFADQASLESKLDEVLDDLVREMTKGDQTYVSDIKPWFGGELAFSAGPLPASSDLLGGDVAPSFRALALLSIKDAALAQAWFDSAIAKSGASTTTQSYAGSSLTVFQDKGVRAAFTLIDGKVAVAGDLVSVKAAVDTKGTGGFATGAGPKAALAASSDDSVGFAFLSLRPLIELSDAVSGAIGGSSPGGTSSTMVRTIPDWAAFRLRVEDDAIVMQAVSPQPSTPIGPTENRRSAVIDRIPGSAVVAITANDVGTSLGQLLDLFRGDPAFDSALDDLNQGLALLGGFDAAVGWVGDTAIVVNVADGTPEGGLIVAPTDQAAAARLFTSLRAFIALGGAQQGITARDETYNGTTITILDLGDLGGAAGESGLPIPDGGIQIAYALADDVVVIGSGPDFVKHVLDTTNATSLGSNARYAALADRAGTGTGTTFVDLAAARTLLEEAATDMADPSTIAEYEKDIEPFVLPFDALFASNRIDGDLTRSVIYVTVK